MPHFHDFYWSVGPRRPSDQSDAIVAGFLYMFVSIFLCLVAGFRPRFHSGHLAPSEGTCLKRQTTYQVFDKDRIEPSDFQGGYRVSPDAVGYLHLCKLARNHKINLLPVGKSSSVY